MKQENSICSHCAEPVPDMIKTLWTLKNMDKIQSDASYENNGSYSWQARPGQVWQFYPSSKGGGKP